jgi:endo-1,4-beta-xylanase
MKKITNKIIISIILMVILYGCGIESLKPIEGKSLREIVKEGYKDNTIFIGGTTGSWSFEEIQGELLDREFSYVTPENDYKHSKIRPNNQTWVWEQADAWEQHIINNEQVLRMHCPIGPQCSEWAKEDNRSAIELEQELKLFLETISKRYNNKQGYIYMDVVNETVIDGSWHENKEGTDLWECPWFKIGQDNDANSTPLYIKLAFQTVKEYAPDIKFIYNHHEPPSNTASWNLIKSTIQYLQDMDLRVDGIGWQAHVEVGVELNNDNIQKFEELINWAHSNNLEFHITEASVWLKDGHSESQLNAQADTYSTILRILLENRLNGIIAWNTWHVSDAHGWHTEWYPSLFDKNYEPKPAYFSVRDVLLENSDFNLD